MKHLKIIKKHLKKDGRQGSPNEVANISYILGLNLTSLEVVEISNKLI